MKTHQKLLFRDVLKLPVEIYVHTPGKSIQVAIPDMHGTYHYAYVADENGKWSENFRKWMGQKRKIDEKQDAKIISGKLLQDEKLKLERDIEKRMLEKIKVKALAHKKKVKKQIRNDLIDGMLGEEQSKDRITQILDDPNFPKSGQPEGSDLKKKKIKLTRLEHEYAQSQGGLQAILDKIAKSSR